MQTKILTSRQSLNKAYLKEKILRSEIELFKSNLSILFESIDHEEREENAKTILRDFLNNTYYKEKHFINTLRNIDLVIFLENNQNKAAVLAEVKRPTNKSEMITKDNLNAKAMHELILYYLEERIDHKNNDIKFLVATNIYEWFVFDATVFEHLFFKNKSLVKNYERWRNKQKTSANTDLFYTEIARPFLDELKSEIQFTYIDLNEFKKTIKKNDSENEKRLTALYKLLSPVHLLKQPFANDSNSLDRNFYNELLHIIGLVETKEKNKKLINRKPEKERDYGSIIENAILILKTENTLDKIDNPDNYGETTEERLYNLALELSITWINRILFLKLLEAQLHKYHNDDKYKFLNKTIIKDFDELYKLFHQVLAVPVADRTELINKKFGLIPYLNSSLFEISDLESETIKINSLDDNTPLDLYKNTILKEKSGKKRAEKLPVLHYLFEFLDAYDFTSEGKEEIQEDKKTLINASVLGLIFEKINGYKDGSFFTPGFITMYMSRETLCRAVVQKFNDKYNWKCETLDDVKNHLTLRRNTTDILEFNSIINSIKICDPAVGSGHFLVSVLNELIAIKSELGILADSTGTVLAGFEAKVENDELITTYNCGEEIFEYHPPKTPLSLQRRATGSEIQRVQETLFNEKRTIIENCLFGVDINPNSVKIARLRLWIELLKNAYYTKESSFTHLETLPNIDINIKEGNSLISRFDLHDKEAKLLDSTRQKIRLATSKYKEQVFIYKSTNDKSTKDAARKNIKLIKESFALMANPIDKEYKRLKELENSLVQEVLSFDRESIEHWDKRRKKDQDEYDKLKIEYDNKLKTLYHNAFEWRFEFPEVLNDDGKFVGFDVVIGNPPWGINFKPESLNMIKSNCKDIVVRMIDSFMFFINLSFQIKNNIGISSMIVPDVLLYQIDNQKLREKILDNYSLNVVINLGDRVFEDVARPSAIYCLSAKGNNKTCVANYTQLKDKNILESDFISIETKLLSKLPYKIFPTHNFDGYKILTRIKAKKLAFFIDEDGIQRGVSPDLKEAFIVNSAIVNEFNLEKEKLKMTVTGGIDVLKYFILNNDKILLYITPSDDLIAIPNIVKYIDKFKDKITCKEVLEGKHSLYNLHRAREEKIFNKPEKIVGVITGDKLIVAVDKQQLYPTDGLFLFNCDKIDNKFIVGLLNSKLLTYFYRLLSLEEGRTLAQIKPTILEDLPIIDNDRKISTELIKNVEKILQLKKQNQIADTSKLESEIDKLVYQLYGLTEEEIKIVENNK